MFDETKPFPVFSGGKDKVLARKAFDVIGTNGFRTRVINTPDGGQIIHKSKGGFPEVFRAGSQSKNVNYRGYIADVYSSAIAKAIFLLGNLSQAWDRLLGFYSFGDYIVSMNFAGIKNNGSDVQVSDVFVNLPDYLLVYTGNMRVKLFHKTEPTGVPVVFPGSVGGYVPGTSDDNDTHVYYINENSVSHRVLREGEAVDIYTNAELSVGTAGYDADSESSVAVLLPDSQCSYVQTHTSDVGNVLQRTRYITLTKSWPYYQLGTYTSHNTQGFVYVPPTGGTPETQTLDGVWLNPYYADDKAFAVVCERTGGPYPASGLWAFSEYLEGSEVDDPQHSSSTQTNYTDSNGYSDSIPVGWFGTQLQAEVSVSTSATHVTENGSGRKNLTTPVFIAYTYYGSTTEPPSTYYKWGDVTGNSYPGAVVADACSGSSVKKTWGSSSVARCSVAGETVLHMNYSSSGEIFDWHGTNYKRSLHNTVFLDGTKCNFPDPSVNSYPAEWGMVKDVRILTSRDQQYAEGVDSQLTKTFVGESVDFILFDKPNNTYVFLKGAFFGSNGLSSVTLSVCVTHNGVTYENVLRQAASDSFSWLFNEEQVYQECSYWNPPNPFNGFAPAYCNQGLFKYGAYSESHETDHVRFLMALPLVLQNGNSENAPNNCFVAKAKNFKTILGFAALSLYQPFWEGFANEISNINFKDDQFVGWDKELHPDFATDINLRASLYRT